MASRNDGRIQPGQKLASAISARAWNRAQDAADIVLGQGEAVAADPLRDFPGRLVVKCNVTVSTANFTLGLGHIIDYRHPTSTTATIMSGFVSGGVRQTVAALAGVPFQPAEFVNRRAQANRGFGVVVGGLVMPTNGQTAMVDLCVAGPCVARVKNRSTQMLPRVMPYVIRDNFDLQFFPTNPQDFVGLAEESSCGNGVMIQNLQNRSTGASFQYQVIML
jgi:hypothetical protein